MIIAKQIYYYLIGMRPKQRIKNLIIFIPILFSGKFLDIHTSGTAFLLFFLLSFFVWASYHINDYKDREKDRIHPTKKDRPLASGKLNTTFAVIASICIMISCIFVAYFINPIVALLFIIYLINTVIYSFYFKKKVIIDVFSISAGFIIRWLIGCFGLGIPVSERLMIILLFGSLLFGFVKRYQECKLKTETRDVMKYYNSDFLSQIIWIMTWTLILSYSLYSFQSIQSKRMVITVPITCFILLRIYYNIFFLHKYSEWLEEIVLEDKQILIAGLIYILLFIGIKIFTMNL